jgi:hypothetical protein
MVSYALLIEFAVPRRKQYEVSTSLKPAACPTCGVDTLVLSIGALVRPNLRKAVYPELILSTLHDVVLVHAQSISYIAVLV